MLRLHKVSKYYKSNDVVALGLRRVSLEFEMGEFVAVTGESGSGKSTLLNVISGLDTYEDGEMYIAGEETSYFSVEDWENYRKQYIGFVFQNYNIIDSYTVLDNVLMALQIQGYNKSERKARAMDLIRRVGLESHMHHKASKLSGGQKQRCVIARALAKDCPIIVADEPTGNLDQATSKTIIELLKEISKDKLVIVVTHNYDEVAEYATRKIRLFDGEVMEDQKIRKAEISEKDIEIIDYHMGHLELMKISLKNLLRAPRRSIFTVIIAIVIIAAFIFGFGSYKKDSASSWSNYNEYFRNVNPGRIIVADFEGEPFTDDDIAEILGINNVIDVVEHDVVLDTTAYLFMDERRSYYYYEDEPIKEGFGQDEEQIQVWPRDLLITPASMVEQIDLVDGTLPDSKYEIILSEQLGYSVGDTVRIGTKMFWGSVDSFEDIEGYNFEVVGIVEDSFIVDWNDRGYFHKDFIDSEELFVSAYFKADWFGSIILLRLYDGDELVPTDMYSEFGVIGIDNTLADGEVEIGLESLRTLIADQVTIDYEAIWSEIDNCYNNGGDDCWLLENQLIAEEYNAFLDNNPGYFSSKDYSLTATTSFYSNETDIEIVGFLTDESGNIKSQTPSYTMNMNTIMELAEDERYQVSVIVPGSFQATAVQKQLSDLGYRNIYPSGIVSEEERFFSIFNYIFLGITFGFFLTITYFIVYLVLRNVQISKKKDYLVYRSIGASKRDLNFTTIYELTFATTIGYIIAMALFVLNENVKTPIPRLLEFLDLTNYIVAFLLLTLLAVLLGNRFNKKIFNRSVITALKQE